MSSWADAVAIATRLPETEGSTSYGTPALKVRGKLLARQRGDAEDRTLIVCDLAEKQALLSEGHPAFSTTPHYDGYGAVLVQLALLDRAYLEELLTEAWRLKAPAKLRAANPDI